MISLFGCKLASTCSQDAPSQSPFDGLSFAVSFRRRHRCAPVTHRATGEMLAILFWCAPASGDCCSRGL